MTKEDLIKGKWYYGQNNEKWLFRFIEITTERKIGVDYVCTPDDGYKNKSVGSFSNLTDLKLADKNTVLKFFPECAKDFEFNYEIF